MLLLCCYLGVIFLASYKLSFLFSSQNREIERNIAIKDAILIYEKIFEKNENEKINNLISNLKELRNQKICIEKKDIIQEAVEEVEEEAEKVEKNQETSQKFRYSREELLIIRNNNCFLNEKKEIPIGLESYQQIHSSHSEKLNEKKHGSNKKNHPKKKESNNNLNQNRQWGLSSNSGVSGGQNESESVISLDSILDSAVGSDHIIVKENS